MYRKRGESEMEQERYVKTGSGTFFGDYLYDVVVPQDHFLRKLREPVDWDYFTVTILYV
jgi:hypothetical protein